MKKIWIVMGLWLGLCGVANAVPIGLAGDTVDAAVIRTINDPFYGVGRIFGYGLDAPFQVVDGTADQKNYGGSFLLNIDNLAFDVDFNGSGGWQAGIILRLSGLNFLPGQVLPFDLDIDTNIAGLSWNVGADFVDIHLYSVRQTSSSFIRGTFNVVAVPEPSSILLLSIAAFGLTLSRKRK